MPRTRVYVAGKLTAEDFPVADVSDHLECEGTVVWVDYCNPTKEELHELADELGLHELAVEDALGPHQRSKVDRYATHLFVATHAVRLDREAGELVETEVDAFVHPRWLITVRKDEDFPIDDVLARWDRSPDLAARGVGFLLYGLLDVVVDDYFAAVEGFDDFYDEISDGLFADQAIAPAQQRHWFQMRQSLVRLHRLVVPMREAVSGLMRRDQTIVDEHLYPYYQDVYDHVLRVTEDTDRLRDLVATIVETHLSLSDYRTNQIVKRISGWAAILAVPTLITGYYGMNVPYPGSGEVWGAWAASGLVIVVSGALYLVMKRRDWL